MFLVFGCGLTGLSVAKFLAKRNLEFIIYDTRDNPKNTHKLPKCEKYFKDFNLDILKNITTIILSPGINPNNSPNNAIINQAKKLNIDIISDTDLFYSFYPAKTYIGITGTNGKSTTTKLLEHILNYRSPASIKINKKAIACGNIGLPICDINPDNFDIFIIEMSSYQIDITNNIKFDYATILNITPDHLDRYQTFENYKNSKLKIIKLSKNNIINPKNIYTQNISGIKFINEKFQTKLLGEHNTENILAAATISQNLGLKINNIANAIKSFKGLPHRLEFVVNSNGIDFYNDSKATNSDATITAIRAIQTQYKNITLILGGEKKDEDYTTLMQLINQNIQQVILIGKSTEFFQTLLKINYIAAINMADVIKISKNLKTDVVVLSPACASFDMYNNFTERGDDFKKLIHKLC